MGHSAGELKKKEENNNEQIQHNIFFRLCFPFLGFPSTSFYPNVPCGTAERRACVDSRKNNQQRAFGKCLATASQRDD